MEHIVIQIDITPEHIEQIIFMVSKVVRWNGHRIEKIEKLPGGLTNENFKVATGGKDYAVRIAGKGTAEMIDRLAEENNARIMAEAGSVDGVFWPACN